MSEQLTSDELGKQYLRPEWSQKVSDHKHRCLVCPRACELIPGQRGFCFVRKGSEQGVYLSAYGQSSGFCIDPIEKKPLNHFLPGSSVLSFGTVGCNLGCQFCQNWDISKVRKQSRLLDHATPSEITNYALANHCKSVAFTYNDPVIFIEFAIEVAKECHKKGIQTVAVSAGYLTETTRPEFFSHIDAVNIDLKAFSNDFYEKYTLSQLQPVLDTLICLAKKTEVWFEITTLLIPGLNDSDEEIEAMSHWIVENLGPHRPLHFSAFHPDFRMKDIPNTPLETLLRARDIARKAGIHFVYTGNVHHAESDSTFCPNCNHLLIERDWYEIGKYQLEDANCPNCKEHISGVFEGGDHQDFWGRRRESVQIHAENN